MRPRGAAPSAALSPYLPCGRWAVLVMAAFGAGRERDATCTCFWCGVVMGTSRVCGEIVQYAACVMGAGHAASGRLALRPHRPFRRWVVGRPWRRKRARWLVRMDLAVGFRDLANAKSRVRRSRTVGNLGR